MAGKLEIVDETKGRKYVNNLKGYLEKAGVSVDQSALEKAVMQAEEQMTGCTSCANGWHW